ARLERMRITQLTAQRFRSLRDICLAVENLNVLIGANAAGKSNVLDAFRFLAEGVRERDFSEAVYRRGGIPHLAWKGETATSIGLQATFDDAGRTFDWTVRLGRLADASFSVSEDLHERSTTKGSPPHQWLHSGGGAGDWWWSPGSNSRVSLKLAATECAL